MRALEVRLAFAAGALAAGLATAAPPLPPFSVVGAMMPQGSPAVLSLQVGQEIRAVGVGERVEGYRVERFDHETLVLRHEATGERLELRLADLAPAGGRATPVAAAPSGPFTPPRSAPPGVLGPAAIAGKPTRDSPRTGAVLPTPRGEPPPGMRGPQPAPRRTGEPPPAGPVARPVPANPQLPTSR